ncbi:ATP-binding cassette domain-containing protein [Lipingzhangella sp. LS1_29]|uniref:ATP-binding cassette domain-containing protein n=1 Tax=Lipingzhangella rawalii TaxID=2055835 RepID=A0ABU2HBK0_9ACTN|nr:ATP-binding cassette domain-containing protein [Lipingzhangella rawalii]MDS1272190.1 ATP-binding cassette domain-containing protein [Lipingzhangella rawalii]
MRRATGARVEAEGLALRTGHGWVYSNVDCAATPGSLTAFVADGGGGRTALLLTLSGRMRPSDGSLHVDGHDCYRTARAGRQVRRICALGLSAGVNDLDERIRVREHLNERIHLRLRAPRREVRDQALTAAGLTSADTHRLTGELSLLEQRRLGLALALIEEPRLVLVDDVDRGLCPETRAALWSTLGELADRGLTLIATCADAEAARTEAGASTLPLHQGPIEDTDKTGKTHATSGRTSSGGKRLRQAAATGRTSLRDLLDRATGRGKEEQ